MTIEESLGLNEEEIRKRKEDLRKRIPTKPGIKYLEVISKKFNVQPWPFLSYLAYYNPQILKEALVRYWDYDCSENVQAVMEGLKEDYIIWKVISDIKKEQESEDNKEEKNN